MQCLGIWMQDQYLLRTKLLSSHYFLHMGFHRDGRHPKSSITIALNKCLGRRKQQDPAGSHVSLAFADWPVLLVSSLSGPVCRHQEERVCQAGVLEPNDSPPDARKQNHRWREGSPLGPAPECPRKE